MAGLALEVLDQLQRMLRPLATRVVNTVARGVVQLVDDSTKMQLLQLGVNAGEDVPDGEHFQPYGFYSIPLAGAEHVTLFPNGDRGHPLTIVVSDRRYKPTGGQPGEAGLHNNVAGCILRMTKDGGITLTPAAGQKVLIDDGSGAAALPTMADFNGIVSIMNSAGTGAATALPAAVAAYQAAHPTWPAGTTVLKGK